MARKQPVTDIRGCRRLPSVLCWHWHCWCHQLISYRLATAHFPWLQYGHRT